MKNIPLVALAIMQLLIVIIISYRRRERANKYFMALVGVIAVWTVVNASLDYMQNTMFVQSSILDVVNRIGFFLGCLSLFLSFRLSLVFPRKKRSNKLDSSISIAGLLFLPFVLTSGVSGTFSPQVGQAAAQYSYGSLLWLVAVFALMLILLSSKNFINGYNKADSLVKRQTLIIFFGLTGSLVLGVSLVVVVPAVTGNESSIFLGYYAPLLLTSAIIYGIVKHKLFDIRFVVARSLGYLLSVSALGLIYGFLAFSVISDIIFRNNSTTTWQRAVYTMLAVIIAFTFQPLRKFFDRWTNKIFYQDAYDAQTLIDELNQGLVSTIELNRMLKLSAEAIERNIKPEFCVFGLRETEYEEQRIIGDADRKFNKEDIDFAKKITPQINHKVIIADHLEQENKDLQRKMRKNDVAILVRLTSDVSEEGIGYIVLGAKKSGNPYNSQDIRVLETIANSMVIAIENALRFEEIEKFNVTLEQKVEDATRRLERTNAKLVALDETKDDFISMASHQLRTPLTSVKGYLSMVLEGDAGKLNSKQEKLLDQAFISSQRMVYLIADLLNVSRLRTGKFVIELKETNLADVIAGEVEQLVETAEARGLKLTYEKPKNFPTLMLDETKIRQVIMNFTDNAIYYTPEGGHIKVKLEETAQSINFTVTDDGIGVPKHEQHHLFGKFFRAGNARKARPDGTGLGLFMAKKVVIAQGGSIIFKSHQGKGSTFGFTFGKAKLAVPASKESEVKNP